MTHNTPDTTGKRNHQPDLYRTIHALIDILRGHHWRTVRYEPRPGNVWTIQRCRRCHTTHATLGEPPASHH